MASRIGIKDIAAKAGVSVATVSNVMSGRGRVGEATRRRVLEVAEREGFIRNDAAARLRTGRSNLIGVILNNIVNPFFSELVASLETTAWEAGYMTVLATAQNDIARQEQLLSSMVAQGVAGIVLSPVHSTRAEDLARIGRRHVPVVVCVRDVPGTTATFVGVDDEMTGYLAARTLLENGHRQFAFIGGYTGTTTWEGRNAGIARALAEASLPEDACLRLPGIMHADFAAEKVMMMAEQGRLPSAVICFNDDQSAGAYRAARKLGLAIGRDFSVIGCDNIPQSRILAPELTTIDIHPAWIGRTSAEVLLNAPAEPSGERAMLRCTPELVLRGSVARR